MCCLKSEGDTQTLLLLGVYGYKGPEEIVDL